MLYCSLPGLHISAVELLDVCSVHFMRVQLPRYLFSGTLRRVPDWVLLFRLHDDVRLLRLRFDSRPRC